MARLVALGLEAGESVTSSVGGGGLAERSLAHVSETGRPIDHAEPSCGSRGEGVKMGALTDTSLASSAVGARPGVLTLDAEAVVTASPSIVDGGRPFQTLEGLAVLMGGEASDHVDCSMLDIPATAGKAVEERCGVKKPTLVGAGRTGFEMPELDCESACVEDIGDAWVACGAGKEEGGRLCALPLTLRLVEGRELAASEGTGGEGCWEKDGERCCVRCDDLRSAMPCAVGERR